MEILFIRDPTVKVISWSRNSVLRVKRYQVESSKVEDPRFLHDDRFPTGWKLHRPCIFLYSKRATPETSKPVNDVLPYLNVQ